MLRSGVNLPIPSGLRRLLDSLREAGGRPFVVGGAVRDALLGLPVKDFDVEVFGLSVESLKDALWGGKRIVPTLNIKKDNVAEFQARLKQLLGK